MSTNVTSVDCINGKLTITAEGIEWLKRANEGTSSEAWLPDALPEVGPDNVVKMDWSGEGSGTAVSTGVLDRFFSFTRGTAEFMFTWEGGEMGFSGYRVVDGVAVEHEIEFKLGREVDPKWRM